MAPASTTVNHTILTNASMHIIDRKFGVVKLATVNPFKAAFGARRQTKLHHAFLHQNHVRLTKTT